MFTYKIFKCEMEGLTAEHSLLRSLVKSRLGCTGYRSWKRLEMLHGQADLSWKWGQGHLGDLLGQPSQGKVNTFQILPRAIMFISHPISIL